MRRVDKDPLSIAKQLPRAPPQPAVPTPKVQQNTNRVIFTTLASPPLWAEGKVALSEGRVLAFKDASAPQPQLGQSKPRPPRSFGFDEVSEALEDALLSRLEAMNGCGEALVFCLGGPTNGSLSLGCRVVSRLLAQLSPPGARVSSSRFLGEREVVDGPTAGLKLRGERVVGEAEIKRLETKLAKLVAEPSANFFRVQAGPRRLVVADLQMPERNHPDAQALRRTFGAIRSTLQAFARGSAGSGPLGMFLFGPVSGPVTATFALDLSTPQPLATLLSTLEAFQLMLPPRPGNPPSASQVLEAGLHASIQKHALDLQDKLNELEVYEADHRQFMANSVAKRASPPPAPTPESSPKPSQSSPPPSPVSPASPSKKPSSSNQIIPENEERSGEEEEYRKHREELEEREYEEAMIDNEADEVDRAPSNPLYDSEAPTRPEPSQNRPEVSSRRSRDSLEDPLKASRSRSPRPEEPLAGDAGVVSKPKSKPRKKAGKNREKIEQRIPEAAEQASSICDDFLKEFDQPPPSKKAKRARSKKANKASSD